MNAEALQTESSLTIKIFSMHTRVAKSECFILLCMFPQGISPTKNLTNSVEKFACAVGNRGRRVDIAAVSSRMQIKQSIFCLLPSRVVKKNVVSDTGIFSAAGRVILQSERRGILLIFLDVKISQSFVQTGNESLISNGRTKYMKSI